jgi:hypothetical protein
MAPSLSMARWQEPLVTTFCWASQGRVRPSTRSLTGHASAAELGLYAQNTFRVSQRLTLLAECGPTGTASAVPVSKSLSQQPDASDRSESKRERDPVSSDATHEFNATVEKELSNVGLRSSFISIRSRGLNYSLNVNLPPSLTPFTTSRRPLP